MSHFDFYEGPLRSTYSGRPNCSDPWQFLSTTGACPAPVLSTISQLDSEMSSGLLTSSLDLMDCDDLFSEYFLLDDSLWAPEASPPIVDYEEPVGNYVLPDAHQSTCAAIENVFNPETNLAPLTVRRTASVRCRWPNFVRLICLCNRFSYAAAAKVRTRKVLKGVMKKNGKYACEMRIKMKMQKEKNKPIRKVWLGTYQTQAQAARALDVGKFFFNGKEIKSFSNPNSETVLAKLSYLLALPLEELVKKVQKLARHYGENGSLHNFVL